MNRPTPLDDARLPRPKGETGSDGGDDVDDVAIMTTHLRQ